LDKVTQQNSSASEEMAATSEELASQSAQLQETIAYFRIDIAGNGRGKALGGGAPQRRPQISQIVPLPKRNVGAAGTAKVKGNGRVSKRGDGPKGVALELEPGSPADTYDSEFQKF
jgi:methyl-accepting chemotaxis protein